MFAAEPDLPPWWWRGAHLAVLWAFAVMQPLLDLLGGNAEFFVARGNGAGDVIVFSVALTLVPPLALLAVEALAGLASKLVAAYLHLLFVGLLVAMFALQILDGLFDVAAGGLLAGALVVGLAAAAAYARSAEVRSLLSFLAPAPVVFLALFLFFSDAAKIVLPEDDADALAAGSERSPLVVVLFDELATSSLMDGEGRIDGRRFPAFAELAREATWYRNATTVADHTDDAVPAILTGRRPDPDLDPLASDYPENLFTLFAGERRLNVHERTARLCPQSFCETEVGSFTDRMRDLVSDLSVVSGHLLLPASLATGLPSVTEGFSGFGDQAPDEVEELVHVGVDQDAITSFLAGLDDDPRSLHFIHLLLPHVPWRYLPNGQDYVRGDVWREFDEDGEIWAEDERWPPLQAQRAHLLQTGYADTILGRVIERLRSAGAWDDALVVVLADHGVAFTPGSSRRYSEEANIGEVAPMPLFVKAPGQQRGKVDESPVTTVDVLPTIADILGVEIPFEVDGRPASQAGETQSLSILPGGRGGAAHFRPRRGAGAARPRRRPAGPGLRRRLEGGLGDGAAWRADRAPGGIAFRTRARPCRRIRPDRGRGLRGSGLRRRVPSRADLGPARRGRPRRALGGRSQRHDRGRRPGLRIGRRRRAHRSAGAAGALSRRRELRRALRGRWRAAGRRPCGAYRLADGQPRVRRASTRAAAIPAPSASTSSGSESRPSMKLW